VTELFVEPTIAIVLTGMLVGAAGSLLGVFLVLRGNSMLSDAISHAILFGIAVVWLLTGATSGPVQIVGAALSGVLAVFLIESVVRTRRVRQDAAIGLVFPALFSLGVVLLNVFARDVHLDEHTVLLGEIGFVWLDQINVAGWVLPQSLATLAVVLAIDGLFIALFYKALKLATFDPELARTLGFMPTLLFYGLLSLVSGTAVAAFDAVGVVLFICFVIVPPAAAYLLTDRLAVMLFLAVAMAMASAPLGYVAAVALNVSIAGMMALATGGFLILALTLGPRHGLLARRARRRRLADQPADGASSA